MSSDAPRLSRQDIRSVALYQKIILACILAQILAIVVSYAMPPALRLLMGLGLLGVGLVSTVFVFLLATKVYSPGLGVLFAILTFFPCIGLVMLLIINGKATSVLRAHGYTVGLLGADLSQEPPPPARKKKPGDARVTKGRPVAEEED